MNEYLKNLDRIEFVETMACTGHCRHCSEGDHTGCSDHMDGDTGAAVVNEVCSHYRILSLMVFGGEPLLFAEDTCRIIEAATANRIPKREIITNGYFSKDSERIAEVAGKLAKSGVTYIMLSVDAFHQETIPIEPVLLFAKRVAEQGIEIKLNPAWLVSREDNNPYNARTRELLKMFTDEGFETAEGNVIWPEGNAKIYLAEYFDDANESENPYEDDPRDIRAISVNPNGDVLGGNIYRQPVMKILEAYEPSVLNI